MSVCHVAPKTLYDFIQFVSANTEILKYKHLFLS